MKSNGLLSGIRVVDLTSVIFGPYATQIMGDLGADVIKVESLDGDIMRPLAPTKSDTLSAMFLGCNRNKRSLAIDLKSDAGRDAVKRLTATADVFIHSIRPGGIRRLGLSDDVLRRDNPKLIYCNAWGFGQEGRYRDEPAYDDTIQGVSGLADLQARREGSDGIPQLSASVVADKVGSLTVAYSVMAALFHRERTGEAQTVEVPMFETVTSWVLIEHLAGHAFDPPIASHGYPRALAKHRKPQRTSDGYVAVLPYTNTHWAKFFKIAGREEMLNDPRVTDLKTRSAHIGELYAMLAEIMPERTSADWLSALREAQIPALPVNSLEDLHDDPHLSDVGFFERYEHPREGTLVTPKMPTRFSAMPDAPTVHQMPPDLGEHSYDVLREAGLSDSEIDQLLAKRIVASSQLADAAE